MSRPSQPERNAEMLKLRRAGATYAEIAAVYGISAPGVYVALRSVGYVGPNRKTERNRAPVHMTSGEAMRAFLSAPAARA